LSPASLSPLPFHDDGAFSFSSFFSSLFRLILPSSAHARQSPIAKVVRSATAFPLLGGFLLLFPLFSPATHFSRKEKGDLQFYTAPLLTNCSPSSPRRIPSPLPFLSDRWARRRFLNCLVFFPFPSSSDISSPFLVVLVGEEGEMASIKNLAFQSSPLSLCRFPSSSFPLSRAQKRELRKREDRG